jgi:hypothetical protein
MKESDIEQVVISMYRRSQYPDYETAFKNGGAWNMTETYGYTSTMDSITNCYYVAKMLDNDSPKNDIRIRMVVDGVALSECFLSEAQNVMHKELNIE